ncbi:acyl-CoA thioesterase [Mahella australiensis]|uniref:Thioesterase superfamily protein n=1 Tax=Mahella australiensis (strain DSM 15567 / CIP 107919 / 50-1 BON) TaxID=697281 RepID=F3ZZC1_MAHA5|nr:acyl-CoA thioesterase [Mahella australiensis]AEE95731.1 thioesterase superfamily protein [Mahella australiensis 50-1 BON]
MINACDPNMGFKPPSASKVEMTEMVLPNDANGLGNLLGGRLMHWIDIAGAIVASRHSGHTVVTVAVDSLDFKEPIKVGELVILRGKITWSGRTSMEVAVDVYGENLTTGQRRLTNEAYLTFVALDDDGHPTPVPCVSPETPDEHKAFQDAIIRREQRLKRRSGE